MLNLIALFAMTLVPAIAFAKDSTLTMKVSGWHCDGCSGSTKAALQKVDGVKTVAVDTAKGTATVTYDDSKVTMAALEKAVQASGYAVVK